MQSDITFKIISFLLGIVGSLLLFGSGLIAYIFKRHVRDNDKSTEENRQDHIRIFNKFEEIENRKK